MSSYLVRYVRINKFCELTGFTRAAVDANMNKGIWVQGSEYRRTPNGIPMIDMEGYDKWVESGVNIEALKHAANQ